MLKIIQSAETLNIIKSEETLNFIKAKKYTQYYPNVLKFKCNSL